ncbi:hypothetical protein PHMEG_00011364 [Phytophthora megakarya]|uniref:Uncharacterized protein n=1 Tax=Phytophthora megakarya TaxID=4795 RepID=A0A225WBD7_9STRA|nr:hypothetical protein PHMEG_00011364 [Phytophthora megakarya]
MKKPCIGTPLTDRTSGIGSVYHLSQNSIFYPGRETLLQLWKSYGTREDVYTSNEGPIKSTKYSRFTIIAWPNDRHFEYVVEQISTEIAVEEFPSRGPVDSTSVREFLDIISKKHGWGVDPHPWYVGPRASVGFCRAFSSLVVGINDPELAKSFFTKFCMRLGHLNDLTEYSTLVAALIMMIRVYAWSEIGVDVMKVMGIKANYGMTYGVELPLLVAGELDDGEAKQALICAVIGKEHFQLSSAAAAKVLWKNVVHPGDRQSFDQVTSKFQKKQAENPKPYVEVISRHISDYDGSEGQFSVLKAIAFKRMEWLKTEIERLDKVEKNFSWKMPYAQYKGPAVENLLRAQTSPQSIGSTNLRFRRTLQGVEEPIVTITKTKKWFEDLQIKLPQFKAELARWSAVYGKYSEEQ